MPELDLRTLAIVTAIVSIGALVALFALWRSQERRNGVGFWAAGLTCVCLGMAMIGLGEKVPGFVSIVMGNLSLVIGLIFVQRGIRVFANRPPLPALDWGVPAFVALLLVYFTYADYDFAARVILMSIVPAGISLIIVATVLREKDAPWRSAGFGVASVYGVLGFASAARIPFLGQIQASASLVEQSASQSWFFLALIFIVVGSVLTFFLITYAALEGDQRILRRAVTQTSSSVIITDRDGVIKYVNQAFTERTGYTPEEAIGKKPRILRSGETSAELYKTLWETILSGNTWRGEFLNRTKNGELFWEFASISPVKQRDGRIGHFVAVKEDITKRKVAEEALQQKAEELEGTVVELQASKDSMEAQAIQMVELAEDQAMLNAKLRNEINERLAAEEKIRYMAQHDALTDLPNRLLFEEIAEVSLAAASRNRTEVAVAFIDIDGFKAVNDTLGHQAGDQLLQQIAARLKDRVRAMDTVARLGGDEFIMFLADVQGQSAAASVAAEIIARLSEPFDLDAGAASIGASVGIAMFPDDGDTVEALVKNADAAMYAVKKSGKNGYRFASDEKTAKLYPLPESVNADQ